jgi:hypothetical protein
MIRLDYRLALDGEKGAAIPAKVIAQQSITGISNAKASTEKKKSSGRKGGERAIQT